MKTFLSIIFSFYFISCNKIGVFEKTEQIQKQAWLYNNKPTFTFTITDTISSYNIFIVLRHTDAYNYNNLWLTLGSQAPGDTMRYQNLSIELGDDAKGWAGTGMDDIFEVRKTLLLAQFPLKNQGTIHFPLLRL